MSYSTNESEDKHFYYALPLATNLSQKLIPLTSYYEQLFFSLSSNHQLIRCFFQNYSPMCVAVLQIAHLSLAMLIILIDSSCFTGQISSCNCRSAPFKYGSVLHYPVEKAWNMLSRPAGVQLQELQDVP